MNFNTLYAKARRGEVEIQNYTRFDSIVDGQMPVTSAWYKPTVEQLKDIKQYHARISPYLDMIYSNVASYRLRLTSQTARK